MNNCVNGEAKLGDVANKLTSQKRRLMLCRQLNDAEGKLLSARTAVDAMLWRDKIVALTCQLQTL